MSHINRTIQENNIAADISAVNRIPIVPQLLDVICRSTGMGFAAIARVTEDRWITCTSKDDIAFGLKEGDELKVETTMCQEVRESHEPIFIDHVEEDVDYCNHPVPKMYGITSYVSFPIIKKDGTFFGTLCAVDTRPARVKKPEITGMFKLFADLISFHLQAIEDIDSVAEKLEQEKQHAETREQFIAILGHDLRNPIATTKMSSEILLKTSKEEMTLRQAKTIKSTTFRMEGLVENILDFARGRFGDGIILNRERNNGTLKKTITQIVREVQTLSPEVELKVDLQLECMVDCDKDRIGQLLSNLLNNAITHGATDQPIEMKALADGEEFSISVTNRGEKIPDEAIKHLFQPFYREKVRPEKQGLGLGLFIASEIARAHEGRMHVDSTDERTKFTFRMPLKENENLN